MPHTHSGLSSSARIGHLPLLDSGWQDRAAAWRHCHLVVGTVLALHLAAIAPYLSDGDHHSFWWPLLAGALAAGALVPGAPPLARAVLLSSSLGLLVGILAAIPHMANVAGLDLTVVLLAASVYRHHLPWLACAAIALPALTAGSLTNPHALLYEAADPSPNWVALNTLMLVAFALVISGGVQVLLARVRRQGQAAVSVYHDSRALLSTARLHASTATSVEAGAQLLLESLCDERWPIGHLYLHQGGTFVSTDVWSSTARERYPVLVGAHTMDEMGPADVGSAVGQALLTGSPLWLSGSASSSGAGLFEQEMRPWRAAHLRAAGVRSGLLVPISSNGQCVAVMELFGPEELTVPPEELHQLHLVASTLSQVAERQESARQDRTRIEALHAMTTSAPDALVVYDQGSGRLRHYSRGSFDWWPASAQDIPEGTVAGLAALTGPDYCHVPEAERNEALAAGLPVMATVLGADGHSRVPIEAYRSVHAIDGEVQSFTFIRDVSAREEAAETLHRASERAAALLEVVDAGVVELDQAGMVRYANRQAERLLEAAPAELLGTPLLESLPFLSEQVRAALSRCQASTAAVGRVRLAPVSGQLLDRNGQLRPVAAGVLVRRLGTAECDVVITLTDASHAHHAAQLALRQSHALELNDTVVQGVSTALYALEAGQVEPAETALRATLAQAKKTIATLLADTPFSPALLQRRTPARLDEPAGSPGQT